MGHPELGLKYTCTACAARFYDLHREPAVCPKCQTEQPKPKPRSFAPSRGVPRSWSAKAPIAVAQEPAEAEAEEEEVLDDADAVESDLLDDDDDDAEVIPIPQEEV
jgi:uncharacterized protein (TIGR02300 family)